MITFWIALLRAAGTVLFLVGVVGGGLRMLLFAQTFVASFESSFIFTMTIVTSLALVVVCFGAASILSAQRRTDAKLNAIIRAASRRRPVQQPADHSLAPEAPNWPEMKLGIHPAEQERQLARSRRLGTDDLGGLYENVVAHGVRVGVPTVREAPPPIRVTPGTEGQYLDTPPITHTAPRQRSQVPFRPHERGVDRELLRQARDKQIRERQVEQQRRVKR